jgi:hypothetical protein
VSERVGWAENSAQPKMMRSRVDRLRRSGQRAYGETIALGYCHESPMSGGRSGDQMSTCLDIACAQIFRRFGELRAAVGLAASGGGGSPAGAVAGLVE